MKAFLKINLVLFALLFTQGIFAQNSGFIGKKNIISLDARVFNPLMLNISRQEELKYKANGSQFEPARNLLSYGMNLSIGRTLANRFAFHIQASVLNYKMLADVAGNFPNLSINRSTYFKGKAFGIMPILEFASSGGILPLGLSHQVGLGFYRNKVVKDDYLFLARDYYSSNQDITLYTEDQLFDYDNYSVKSYSLMYKLNLRLPVSRSVLYNLGIRYNLNFTQNIFEYDDVPPSGLIFSAQQHRNIVARTQLNNIISVETGFSFVF